MTIPKFAVPTGAIDGINTVFSVGEPYSPGSVAVFYNGLLVRIADDDGWTESDPSTGEVTLTAPPLALDTVNIFFIDTTPAAPETVLDNIFGTLKPVDDLTGNLTEIDNLVGSITVEALLGTLEEEGLLAATLVEIEGITGTLEEDCT